jgi:hypothetical protein
VVMPLPGRRRLALLTPSCSKRAWRASGLGM